MLLVPLSVEAQSYRAIHVEHHPFGLPRGTSPDNDLVVRSLYSLSNNRTTRFPDWVAYRITPADVWGTLTVSREWMTDPWLDESATLEAEGSTDDYARAYAEAGYDRGHLAPLATFAGNVHAAELNYYSNIVPQTRALNRGPWRSLESHVRDIALRGHVVYVITGPLYEPFAPLPLLPGADEPHTVPTAYWKVVVTVRSEDDGGAPVSPTSAPPHASEVDITAYLMPQTGNLSRDIASFVVPVAEIEARTGFDLFPRMDGR